MKIEPTEPVKPIYHQTIGRILEAEIDVRGCIKNEVLRFIVKQFDGVSPSVVLWTYEQNERHCSLLD